MVYFLESKNFPAIDVNCKRVEGFLGLKSTPLEAVGLSCRFARGTYPLHEATKLDDAYLVYWLLYLGADPTKKDSRGAVFRRRCLHVAMQVVGRLTM